MAETPKFKFPLLDDSMTADVPRDFNALAALVEAAILTREDSVNKGKPNGYAGLDASGQLPKSLFGSGIDADKLGGSPADINPNANTIAKRGPTGNLAGQVLVSQIPTGTAPLTVASQTVVTNLNADMVDGWHVSTTAAASTVAGRDSLGDITAQRFIAAMETGTAPFIVLSTTVVPNLNADMVDGYHVRNTGGGIPLANSVVSANLNADMVDGLHAASFAKYGGGVPASTLNNAATLDSGMYTTSEGPGIGLPGSWYHVIHMRHASNDGHAAQIAIEYFNSGSMYFRSANGTTWGSWRKTASGTDTWSSETAPGVHNRNGYQKLPNGLIFQWGLADPSTTDYRNTTVWFPMTFPNYVCTVICTPHGYENQIGVENLTTSSFLAHSYFSPIKGYFWFAIGK
ncbi:pyocin knob domain-containing protein [Cohnella nanjingensis]|uniref:Putative tail fiber protein gp53-like C-terminal domain-containing protein n=1 Tax=Cohnella nanjingensis TaxID=1387779 RepID=A0A7X0VH18_9BACL|nr:pyocin knob domain-containing protein [Cohnella nanjingensis]MBB6673028.1 hypothetical protein [Cohnella nanjingensis]